MSEPRVEQAHLGTTGAAVYCGCAHALFGRQPDLDELLSWPFSVPYSGDAGRILDGWPVDLDRRVGFRITTLASNEQVSLSGRFLTVLPSVVAEPHVREGRLHRLEAVELEAIQVWAAWRKGRSPGPAAEAVVEAVAEGLH